MIGLSIEHLEPMSRKQFSSFFLRETKILMTFSGIFGQLQLTRINECNDLDFRWLPSAREGSDMFRVSEHFRFVHGQDNQMKLWFLPETAWV